jgi:hypothetical protein
LPYRTICNFSGVEAASLKLLCNLLARKHFSQLGHGVLLFSGPVSGFFASGTLIIELDSMLQIAAAGLNLIFGLPGGDGGACCKLLE